MRECGNEGMNAQLYTGRKIIDSKSSKTVWTDRKETNTEGREENLRQGGEAKASQSRSKIH